MQTFTNEHLPCIKLISIQISRPFSVSDMEKENDEHLFMVGSPEVSWKWRAEIAEGANLRRKWLMYVWTQGRLCCSLGPHWLHFPCPLYHNELNFYQVVGFGVLNPSWIRCHLQWGQRLYYQDPQQHPNPMEVIQASSWICVLSFLYTVNVLQTLGGMEVQRGKFSFKWEIQPSSFRKVNAQRESQCSHISVYTDWLSKAFDLLEKLLPRDLWALRRKNGTWVDICSLCKTTDWFQVWSKWVSILITSPYQ